MAVTSDKSLNMRHSLSGLECIGRLQYNREPAQSDLFIPTSMRESHRMIFVIATIHAKPGKRAELLQAFHQLVPLVRAEDGCVEYGPAIDADTPIKAQLTDADAFTVIERWESVAALEAHLAADHMTEYRERVKDLVDGVDLRVLEPA